VFEQIRKYDFASAIHVLEKISNATIANESSTPSLYAQTYGSIQFRATVRHAPSTTAISHAELRKMKDGNIQPVLWVNFTGIAGIQGPLPLIYTERVFRNMRNKDYAFASFLDMFNHRIAKLTYDIQQWIPGYSACPPEHSQLGKIVLALGGVDYEQLTCARHIPPDSSGFIEAPSHVKLQKATLRVSREPYRSTETSDAPTSPAQRPGSQFAFLLQSARYLITYKTLFVRKVRSAAVLKQILQNFFCVKVCVSEFEPTWVPLRDEDVTKIGGSYTLGKDIFLGNRIWRYNKSLRITLQDISSSLYESFNCHTDGDNWGHLQRLAQMFLPSNIRVRFLVQLQGHCKKTTVIGSPHSLGFNTWLGTDSSVESCLQICPSIYRAPM
jgi:type VI secretion system protein ImpH